MCLLRISFAVMLLLMSWSNISQAQADGAATSAKSKTTDRKQTLNFEDELVEGSAQKPELFYLFQKKNFNYKRLIKLRENFLPEMRRTTEDVQRLRGGR